MENEKNVIEDYDFKNAKKATTKVKNVMLLDDHEKAKAKGIREQMKAFLDFAFHGEANLKQEAKDYIKDVRDGWDDYSFVEKTITIISAPACGFGYLVVNGFLAALTGVKGIEYLIKLRDGLKTREKFKNAEMEDKLYEFIDKYKGNEKALRSYVGGNPYITDAGVEFMNILSKGGQKR